LNEKKDRKANITLSSFQKKKEKKEDHHHCFLMNLKPLKMTWQVKEMNLKRRTM